MLSSDRGMAAFQVRTRGVESFQNQRYGDALADFEEALRLAPADDPNRPVYMIDLGNALQLVGRFGEAEDLYNQVLQIPGLASSLADAVKAELTKLGLRRDQTPPVLKFDAERPERPLAATHRNRTFRIFVSSTFSDLREERNALQERVFPKLRELCMQHGCRFQAIDLRWGVSEEAGLDQQTMNICLEEIERCRKTSPRPNFIVLLGDRYGWRPLPPQIPTGEFNEIVRLTPDERDRQILRRWYCRDDNAVPAEYVLQPRKNGYEDYECWSTAERELRSILLRAVAGMHLEPLDRLKYEASATEQEIHQGALRVTDAHKHVFCFLRSITGRQSDGVPRPLSEEDDYAGLGDYFDLDLSGRPDADARTRLAALKAMLCERLPRNVHHYQAELCGGRISTEHLSKLCEDVYALLSRIIITEIEQIESVDPLDKEVNAHRDFGRDRVRAFVGRAEILDDIDHYLAGNNHQPIVVHGGSGSGKSALMAKALEQARRKHPEAVIVERFIGATPASSDGRSLLEALCLQIARAYGADETAVSAKFTDLVQELPKRLALASEGRPLILFLDALDQLATSDGAQDLAWLPMRLPDNVRVVVSTLEREDKAGNFLRALRPKLPPMNFLHLSALTGDDGAQMLDELLKEAWRDPPPTKWRTLQKPQRDHVLAMFARCSLPLYLRLAWEEARRWRSYEQLPRRPDGQSGLSGDIPGIIRDLFWRLSLESNHGRTLVSRSLGYLAAARYGLAEDELLDVLSLDEEVKSDFKRRSPKSPEVDRLPVVVWSRLFLDIEPYLTERGTNGANLLGFYHRQLGEVVAEDYLSQGAGRERHAALAAYFRDRHLWVERDGQRIANARKVSEMPYQQTHGERWPELETTLTDLEFIEAKCAAALAYDLVADYNRLGVGRVKLGPPMRTASLHDGELGVQCPFCLSWFEVQEDHLGGAIQCQHCRNELRLNSFTIDAEWRVAEPKRSVPGRQESLDFSPSPELVEFANFVHGEAHVLQRHPTLTTQQARNWPDASAPAVTARARDKSTARARPWLRWTNKPNQWDGCLATLSGHESSVTTASFSPDGRRIVSGANDHTVKIWDTESGACLATFTGFPADPRFGISSCVFSPDGQQVAVACSTVLSLRDGQTGSEIRVFHGHSQQVTSCAFSSDGLRLVSASDDKTLKVWDVRTGACLVTLAGHSHEVLFCTFSPNGRQVLSRSRDGTLKMWEASSGTCRLSIGGQWNSMGACAFSPDGSGVASISQDPNSVALKLTIWSAENGEEVASLWWRSTYPCAFSPDGRRIAAATLDKTLRVWDVESKELIGELAGRQSYIDSCAFSPDGRLIVSTCGDSTLKLWAAEGVFPTITYGRRSEVVTATFSPDGRRLATTGGSFILDIWDTQTGAVLRSIGAGEDRPNACAFSPNGRHIAVAPGGTLRIMDVETGEEIANLVGHERGITACAFSPDAGRVVSAAYDSTLRLWDTARKAEMATLVGHAGPVTTCAFSPDGQLIASGSYDNSVRIWDGVTGAEIAALVGHRDIVSACAFSPDGSAVTSASADGTLKIWDSRTGSEIATLSGHSHRVKHCAYSPDGRRVVSAALDGRLKVWDTETHCCLATLVVGCSDSAWHCTFSPDGRYIVSMSSELIIWDAIQRVELGRFWTERLTCPPLFAPDGTVVATGDNAGWVYILQLEDFDIGPLIATAWSRPGDVEQNLPPSSRPRWEFWQRPAKAPPDIPIKASLTAFGCPHCRMWPEVPESALGTVLNCPRCGQSVRLNPFTIHADWRPVAEAWRQQHD